MEQMEQIENGERYEKIGPTAWGVAYFRSLSDIKYAKEIFQELDKAIGQSDATQLDYIERAKKRVKLAPQFEARYKLVDRLIAENETGQVLEIAAGLSPRGLTMTEQNPSWQYVEMDLPPIARRKKEILEKLYADDKAKPQSNLYIESRDALSESSLFAAARHFGDRPISIVNEGLLRYLNFDQKAAVARNVHALLEKFDGEWITSDITLKKILAYEQERAQGRSIVLALSGIDVEANAFEDEDAAHKFFEGLGFSIERRGFLEVSDQLTTPEKLGLSSKQVEEMLKQAVVFVMRALVG